MEVEESYTKIAKRQLEFRESEEAKVLLRIDLSARIIDEELTEIEIVPWGGKAFSLFPTNLRSDFNTEYVEKLTKFLDEVLKLLKKKKAR